MKLKKPTLIDDWRKQLKSYSFLSLFGTLLISLAYGLSVAFGTGLVSLSPMYILLVIGIIAGLGTIGKFIKQTSKKDEDDVQ